MLLASANVPPSSLFIIICNSYSNSLTNNIFTFKDFGIRINFKFFENQIDVSDEDLQTGDDNIFQVESENEKGRISPSSGTVDLKRYPIIFYNFRIS